MPSTRSLRLASAAALTAAMPLVGVAVIPAATLPAAVADDLNQCRAVSSASMAWGIKQSFRNYLTGPIASGGWDLDGVAYSGSAPNAADGAFNFTADPSRSRVEGDDADLPMNGKIHLTGHGGIINVTLDNFELQIRGNRAQLLADGRYLAADPAAVVSLVGGPPAFTRQPVATFSLERTLTQAGSSTGSATVTGSSWIHENLNKGLLGSYGEGKNDGDPVSITVATSGAGDCGVDRNAVMASSAGQKDATPTASAPATAANAPQATQPAQQNTQNNPAAAASPVADTTTCDAVTGAQVGWGLKQSFRNYLTGPIAMGNWQLSEVGFSGSQGGADGQFQFSADPAAIRISGTDADIPLKGSVHLTGHFGALDITYSNMKVKVRGTTAQFIADYRSNTVSSFTATAQVTGAKTGTQVPIAQFDLTQPITEAAANSGTISLNGPGYITEDGNQSLGGNYGAGNNGADPINISLKTSGAGCGIGTGGGLGAIATAGQASSGGSASAADAVTGTPDLGVAPRVSATTTGAATGAAAAADTTCAAGSGDRKVVETRMGWGIKDSFRSYIKGSIAKGDWTPTGGAVYNSGNFIFSGSDGTVGVSGGTATSGTLLFGGSVLFTGHEGVLRTVISSPEIRINGNSASLIANVESNDRSGNPKDYGRIVVADLSLTKASVSEGVLDGSATAALSADGATALAGFYKAGDALDPVSFRAALSDDCSGNKAASLGDKPRDESDGEDAADEGAQGDGKLTVTSAPDSTNADDSEDKDTGLVAFLKDPASMVPSIIAIIAAAAAGVMAVRLRRTNRRIDEVAAAAGVSGGEPGQND